MPKYKIQTHPEAAPITVRSREAVAKSIAVYNRITKANTAAYPYFIRPLRPISPGALAKGDIIYFPPITLADAEGIDCKSCYRGNLEIALKYVYIAEDIRRNKGANIPGGFTYPGNTPEGEKERSARAKAEALEVLSLIDEYNALPEALPYTGNK